MMKVIILHGWTKNPEKWGSLLSIFKDKKINFEFPKIPGLTENLDKVWDLPDYVGWLKNIVDKEKDKVILIGHSNGGRIALSFSSQYPDKVEKLILIDSAGIYHNELPHRLKIFVFKTIAKLGKKITTSRRLEDILYKLAREGDYKKSDPIMKQTMLNLLNSNKDLVISKITIPTLIIWGREDKITPLSDGVLMNKLIKNSKLEIIEGAKHAPMYTHAGEVANIILNNI